MKINIIFMNFMILNSYLHYLSSLSKTLYLF